MREFLRAPLAASEARIPGAFDRQEPRMLVLSEDVQAIAPPGGALSNAHEGRELRLQHLREDLRAALLVHQALELARSAPWPEIKTDAFSVHDLREEFSLLERANSAYAHPSGHSEVRVQGVQQEVHAVHASYHAYARPHRGAAFHLPRLRENVRVQSLPEQAYHYAPRRRRIDYFIE